MATSVHRLQRRRERKKSKVVTRVVCSYFVNDKLPAPLTQPAPLTHPAPAGERPYYERVKWWGRVNMHGIGAADAGAALGSAPVHRQGRAFRQMGWHVARLKA